MNKHNDSTCVILEYDYKGSYSRFALTLDEFRKDFIANWPEIPEPSTEGESITTRPLVHIWYKLCDMNSDEFRTFFTDMAWGLSESDLENKNYAVIDLDECQSLRERISKFTEKGAAN